ncbi:MAG TPA: M50 family metallopeptidase [Kofleriaceae bacterium]|jgi:regulator of sigma E protease|nr:M50 family metallopeptidase [Kofleriaceae bacterium]
MYYLGAILGLGFLIVVHEAGHFVVARLCGMRVERFSIGFGPGLLKWKSKKGTTFQIAPIPFGGFVEIKGMNIAEDVDPDDKAAYPNRPVWQRILTIFAGPGTNYLAAVVLAFGLYSCVGVHGNTPRYEVGTVNADFPAAGKLQPGDTILAIDGQQVWANGPDGQTTSIGEIANKAQGRELTLTIDRKGQQMDVLVGTKYDDSKDIKRWRLGIVFADKRVPIGVGDAAIAAIKYPYLQTKQILGGLYLVITGKVEGDVTGPLGIGSEIKKQFEAGFVVGLSVLMMLNVYLGLFNLFPLPALDGGRLAFLGYELVTRRRANPKIETAVHMVGVLLLIVVMVLVTVKDIRRVF